MGEEISQRFLLRVPPIPFVAMSQQPVLAERFADVKHDDGIAVAVLALRRERLKLGSDLRKVRVVYQTDRHSVEGILCQVVCKMVPDPDLIRPTGLTIPNEPVGVLD